ncbi:hypothetical protein [Primorskyibacter sp. S87]
MQINYYRRDKDVMRRQFWTCGSALVATASGAATPYRPAAK